MPILHTSTYHAPAFFKNKHLNTMHSHLFRKVEGVSYERSRIDTPDGDFLDLDRSSVGSDTVVIIVHGLEGSSNSVYLHGMVRAMNNAGWDAAAMNLRSCSDEPNRLFSSYHSGRSDDLGLVVRYLENLNPDQSICLVGFSLGGNIVLKYVGEQGATISTKIKGVAAVSVPCDLRASSIHLSKSSNTIYLKRLLRSLKQKARIKKERFPETPFSLKDINSAKTFHDFDGLYTAPAHGFASADDYYEKCSSKFFIPDISVPTLLINALDDPFLNEDCFPFNEARENGSFFLETPKYGGHVGFNEALFPKKEFWNERRVVEHFKGLLG